MAKVAIVFGVLLTALGVVAYVSSGYESMTAMIPAFVGAPILVLGAVALKEQFLKHSMHAAAVIGLLGFIASAGRLVQTLLSGDPVTFDLKFSSILLMAILTGIFLGLCVKSFIDARRGQKSAS